MGSWWAGQSGHMSQVSEINEIIGGADIIEMFDADYRLFRAVCVKLSGGDGRSCRLCCSAQFKVTEF